MWLSLWGGIKCFSVVTKSNWVLWHHPNSPKSELHPDIQNLAIFLITMSTIFTGTISRRLSELVA
jgi:hypothetical protein